MLFRSEIRWRPGAIWLCSSANSAREFGPGIAVVIFGWWPGPRACCASLASADPLTVLEPLTCLDPLAALVPSATFDPSTTFDPAPVRGVGVCGLLMLRAACVLGAKYGSEALARPAREHQAASRNRTGGGLAHPAETRPVVEVDHHKTITVDHRVAAPRLQT